MAWTIRLERRWIRPGGQRPGAWTIAAALLGAAALALAWSWPDGPPDAGSGVSQPLPSFSHQRHLAPDVVNGKCTVCHGQALTGAAAGRPPTRLCLGCHLMIEPASEDQRRLRAYGSAGQEVPWRRVWRLPAHVVFSHRSHAGSAGLDCAVCHGAMGERSQALQRPLQTLTMKQCVACHAAWPATTPMATAAPVSAPVAAPPTIECNACHR